MGKAWTRLGRFEVCVALSGGAAFAVVGPLRGAFATLPGVLLAGTLILFMVPGVLLTCWFLGEYFSGVAALPAAFVISTGAFALLGAPMLLLQGTLETYLWTSGMVVAASLLQGLGGGPRGSGVLLPEPGARCGGPPGPLCAAAHAPGKRFEDVISAIAPPSPDGPATSISIRVTRCLRP